MRAEQYMTAGILSILLIQGGILGHGRLIILLNASTLMRAVRIYPAAWLAFLVDVIPDWSARMNGSSDAACSPRRSFRGAG